MRSASNRLRIEVASKALCLLAAALLLVSAPAHAQTATDSEFAQLASLLEKGRPDAAIDRASALLLRSKTPDRRVLYMRGMAYRSLQQWAAAETDLAALGDFQAPEDWPPVAEVLKSVQLARSLSPQRMQEIMAGGQVVTRVFYDQDDDWKQGITAQLGADAAAVHAVLGLPTQLSTVFIFADASRFKAYLAAIELPDDTDRWCYPRAGVLLFSEPVFNDAKPLIPVTHVFWRRWIALNYAYASVTRLIGNFKLPMWVVMGTSKLVAGTIDTSEPLNNDHMMHFTLYYKSQMTLEQLAPMQVYYAIASGDRTKLPAGIERLRHPQPEVQAYHMMRYLWTIGTASDLPRLIDQCLTSDNFDASFLKVYGLTPGRFYDLWIQQGEKRLNPDAANFELPPDPDR